uniref:Uncharacterized protein n=1 Tax=Arundo donax TaxID=35708 RepID=A0A0A9HMB2_ARUDO
MPVQVCGLLALEKIVTSQSGKGCTSRFCLTGRHALSSFA